MAIQKQAAAATVAPQEQLVSMHPDSFTSGGLMDDVDVTWSDVLACEYDYNGQAPLGPSLAIEMTDAAGVEHVQYYSAGKKEDWIPSKDGRGFLAVSGKTGINNSTNLGKLLASLTAAGFPMELLGGGDLKTTLTGLQCHMLKEVQERKGLVRRGKNAERQYDVLIVSKIHALPGAEAPAKPATAGTGAGAKTKAAVGGKPNGQATTKAAAPAGNTVAAVDEEVAAKITELATEVVVMGSAPDGFTIAEGNVVPKKDFLKMVFATFKGMEGSTPALCNKAVNLAGNQEFLKSLAESGIAYDGVSLKPAE
jgi:hypothetical protein